MTQNTYTSANRLASRQVSSGTTITTTSYSFDAGNVIFESSHVGGINPISEERASYYGADDKLVAVDVRTEGRKKVEEFRYDPLGRRVWTRYIPTGCGGTNPATIDCYTPSVRRTVWDGSQELAEISAPADTTTPATEELDTTFPLMPYQTAGLGFYGDPNPQYGRVVYSPGLATDQPMSVTRYEYRDNPSTGATPITWPRFSLMIFWDYRGAPAYGLFTNGAWANPSSPTLTSCPVPSAQTNQQPCVITQWPFAQSAYDKNRGKVSFSSWHGSLLRNRQTGTGLEYLRNRMYDPGTGRFTQEDPIGLAGGLNLYGFANGDPVNFSDPYGLQACDPPGSCVSQFVAGGMAVGTAGGAVVAAGCSIGSGGVCVLGAPGIIAAGAGLGGSVGGIVGTVVENGRMLVLEARSLKGRIKEIMTAIYIALGGGKTDYEVPPPPPPPVVEPKSRPKQEGGREPPAP